MMKTIITSLKIILLCLCTLSCNSETEVKAKVSKTFRFRGSNCEVIDVAHYNDGYVRTRFVICDPPLQGMIQGSKPKSSKSDEDTP